MMAWAAFAWWRTGESTLGRSGRLAIVAVVVLVANAALSFSYAKDDIIAVAGVFYAIAAFAAVRAVLEYAQAGGSRARRGGVDGHAGARIGVGDAQLGRASRHERARVPNPQRLGRAAHQVAAGGPMAVGRGDRVALDRGAEERRPRRLTCRIRRWCPSGGACGTATDARWLPRCPRRVSASSPRACCFERSLVRIRSGASSRSICRRPPRCAIRRRSCELIRRGRGSLSAPRGARRSPVQRSRRADARSRRRSPRGAPEVDGSDAVVGAAARARRVESPAMSRLSSRRTEDIDEVLDRFKPESAVLECSGITRPWK